MPALAPVVDNLESVPENARSFYEQKDGKFQLALSSAPAGFVPATELAAANGRVVEFRDNNIKLTKQLEEANPRLQAFDGIDPQAAKDALAAQDALKKKGVKNADDVATLVTSAVQAAVKPLEERIAASDQRANANQKKADDAALRTAVSEQFIKAGGKPKALDYVINQAQGVFTVENGVVKAQANRFSSEKPGDPLGIAEWITGLAKESDFAFEVSGGGGANGGTRQAGGGDGVQLKPGQTVLKDPTPAQLGEFSKDILAGKVKVVYSN